MKWSHLEIIEDGNKKVKQMSKRNAHGGGTIRQRSTGLWEARYSVRDELTGKQVQKSLYGKSQAEARKKLNAVTNEIDNGVYTEPSRLTVGGWSDIWLAEYVRGSVKPNTFTKYENTCRVHIKPALGGVMLNKLSAHTIQAFYNKLREGQKPLSSKSVKDTHGILHSLLKQAQKLGYIKHNPTEACTLPRVEKREIKPLDEADISAFIEAVSGHRYRNIFLVTLFTGLRQGEVLGLQWPCVDFNNRFITVSRQLQKEKKKGGMYYLAPLKNDKTRQIGIANFVAQLLKEQKRTQLEMKFKAGQHWFNDDDLVFTDEIGGALSARSVYVSYKKIVKSIGLSSSRFHDLRHSYAVASLSSGSDIKTISENLGHFSSAFTMDVYMNATDKMKRDAADRMDKYISNLQIISC
jgi:integrase